MKTRLVSLLSLTFLMGAASLRAAQDLETSVPANWTATGGALSISPNHFKMGSQSLKWDWTAGSTITINTPGIPAADVLDYYKNHCDLWVWNGTAQPGSKIRVEFMNGSTPQYWFDFYVNYTGWRHAVRSFYYDMQKTASPTTTFTSVRITAPATGGGSFYLDAVNWVGPRFSRVKDAQNPDVAGYYSDTTVADSFAVAPTIAANTPTAAELADLNTLRSRWLASVKGAAAPGASTVNSANTSFAAMNIVEDVNGIRGQVLANDNPGLESWPLSLAQDYVWGTATAGSSRDKMLQLIRHLFDQGQATNSNWIPGTSYTYRGLPNALILMAPACDAATKAQLFDFFRWEYETGQFWNTNWGRSTDDIYTEATQKIGAMIFFAPSDAEAVRMLKGYRNYLIRFCAFSEGGEDGIKPDGLGFHHNAHYNNYMYSYRSLTGALSLLQGTSFQVDQTSYEHLRQAVLAQMRMSADGTGTSGLTVGYFGNALCGRKPMDTAIQYSQSDLRTLGVVGGSILGQNADPVVAQAYNRRYGANDYPTFTPYGVEAAPDGYYQFNYSPLGIYRRANWVASMRAPQKYFWSSEIYGVGAGAGFPNRYGRYQAYGALEILYHGGKAMSGEQLNGWDWNQPPGTTTIVLPDSKLVAENDREDVRSQLNFSGALAFADGQSGLYAGNFQESNAGANHNPSFVWRKSWFAFGSEIVCLGSDIANNDGANPTVTTLFQGALPTQGTAVTLDGAAVSGFPYANTVADANAHWLLDACGTGYIVPAGSTVKISRATQTSANQDGASAATTGDFAKAWIDHGLAPAGAGYEYAVLPGTNASAMTTAAAQHASASTKPYTVIERDATAHVVKWNATGQIGYAVYTAGALPAATAKAGLLAAVQRPCLVMTKPGVANDATLSVVDPDLNFSAPQADYGTVDASAPRTLDLTVKGKWSLDTAPAGVSLVSASATATVIRVTTQHGAAVHVHLLSADIAPVFTSSNITLPSTVPGAAYAGSLAAYASDADAGDVLAFTKLSGPAWLTVNADGTLSGTPSSSDLGTGAFSVRVTDASGYSADATATILVDTAPVFSASNYTLSVAPVGSGYTGSLGSYASDADTGDTLTFTKLSGPSWLNVNADGTLSGTPSSGDAGSATFTVRVSDASGVYADTTITMSVDTTPLFSASTIALPTAPVGSAYAGSLASYASDADAGDTLTFTKVSGPAWLTVAANGTLSGTPASGDVGSASFAVRVTDSKGLSSNATVTLVVDTAPVFNPTGITLAGAFTGSAYTGSLASYASDADAGDTLTFTKVSGPAWLTVNADGTLSGTPASGDAGTASFTMCVTDSKGLTANATVTISVDTPPVFNAPNLQMPASTAGSGYSGSLIAYASDTDAGDTLTFTKVSVPAWLVVNADGTLSGTPSGGDSGTNTFTVRVTDANGASADTTMTVSVSVNYGNGTWSNTAGGSWGDVANWSGGTIAGGSDKTADFSALNLAADATVTVDGARTVGNVTFGDTTPGNGWTLDAGTGGPLTLAVSTGTPTITVNNGTNTINAVLSGTQGLLKAGSGTLVLDGANTYTGLTTIGVNSTTVGGALSLGGAQSVGGLLINNGTLNFLGGSSVTMPAGTSVNTANANGNNLRILNAAGVVSNAGTLSMQGGAVFNLNVGANWTQSGAMTVKPANTFTSAVLNVNAGAVFKYTGASTITLSASSGTNSGTGTLAISGGSFETGKGFVNTGGTAGSANLTLSGGGTLKLTADVATLASNSGTTTPFNVQFGTGGGVIDTNGFSTTITQAVANASGQTGSLTKQGAGTLTLSGANTYAGTTAVNAGTLVVTGSLGNGAVTVANGATLDGTGAVGGALTVQAGGTLAVGGGSIGTLTVNNAVTLTGSTVLQIGKSGSALFTDSVAGMTSVTYGGNLTVANIGAALAAGDSFRLFVANSYAGNFASVSLPPLSSGLVWVTNRLAVDGTVSVDAPPVFGASSYAMSVASVGSGYTGSVSSYATDAGDTLTYSKVSGPAWLTVNPDGTLSGTPAPGDTGSPTFTVRVTDASGVYADATITMPVDTAPIFSAPILALPVAPVGAVYSGSLAAYASDADAGDTLTFTKVSGPAWLTVNANGTLSGTPSASDVGTGSFTVRVTDANGLSASGTVTIPVDTAPVFNPTSITLPSVTTGSAYAGSLAGYASDADAGDTLTFTKVSGPAWLSVNADGSLSGTPTSANVGVNTFAVRVTDARGLSANATLNIPVDTAPVFSAPSIEMPPAISGAPVYGSLAAYASDPDAGDSMTFLKMSGPAWLTVNADGTLSGTPGAGDVGSATFTVRVIDMSGAYSDTGVVIPVENDLVFESFESGVVSSSWSSKKSLSIVADSVLGSGQALSVPTVGYTYAIRNFAATSLANVGDRLTLSFVFRYTQSPASAGAGFRFGFFDANGNGYNVTCGTGGSVGLSVNRDMSGNFGTGGSATTLASSTSLASILDTAKHTMRVSLVRMNSGALGVSTVVDGTTLSAIDTAPTISTFANAVTRNGNISAGYDIDNFAVVYSKNYAPVFDAATFALPAAATGTVYSASVAARASDDDLGDKLTFTKVSGPAWLTVNTDGTLTGTPASGNVGANTFTVRVTDLAGASADATVTIQVN